MTDEELRKRVAEIEGLELVGGVVFVDMLKGHVGIEVEWNPLANWSDLGPLIEKYKMDISADWEVDAYGIRSSIFEGWSAIALDGEWAVHKSLPHATLMAIVEAHE